MDQLKRLDGTRSAAISCRTEATEFSAYLIKAAAAKPDVLMALVDGADMVACMKQIVQFGLDKKFAIAGGQQSYENFVEMPPEARIGWWVLEWYWKQPGLPQVAEFVEKIKKRSGQQAAAHHAFAYIGLHTYATLANEHKTINSVTLAKAFEGHTVPAQSALQAHDITYRKTDHQLLSSLFVGTAQRGDKDPADLFDVADVVLAKDVAGTGEENGCKIAFPA